MFNFGRRSREGYPGRGGNGGGQAVGRRFTPTFQTSNADASLGDAGFASGTFALVGGILYATGFFNFSGSGVSAGSGALLLPFPPVFSDSSVDVTAMPLVTQSGDNAETETMVISAGVLAGTPQYMPSVYLLEENVVTRVIAEAEWGIDLTGLASGDSINFTYFLPVR